MSVHDAADTKKSPEAAARGHDPRALRAFAIWVALPAAAVYLGVCALVVCTLYVMSAEMNAIDTGRTRDAVRAAVGTLLEQLSETAADEAGWTEAYINTGPEIDPAWLDSTWGATARIGISFDTVLVTDMEGTILFAESSRGAFEGKVADNFTATAELLAGLEDGVAESGDGAVVAHMAAGEAGVFAVAASAIHSNTGQVSVPRNDRRILWLAKQLDEQLLQRTAERHQLPLPRLDTVGWAGGESVPLVDAAGERIAMLQWTPRRPGDPAFLRSAGIASMVMLVIGLLVLAVLMAFRQSIVRRETSEARDWHNARHDLVTGLPNRFGLEEQVRMALPKRGEAILAVTLVGVDGLAEVTASYGRETGELLLAVIADTIERGIDGAAFVARVGQAEFAVAGIGPDATAQVAGLAQRMLGMASEAIFVNELKLKVEVSFGFAAAPASRATIMPVLAMAETALARARETGGNQIIAYDPAIEDGRRRRLALQADIRRGLEAGEFDLAYQPIFDFDAQAIVGVEALLRWPRRPGGVMSPGEFIPAAEASGLIEDLGLFALERAAAEIGPLADLKISVNVSPRQFRNPLLGERIDAVLAGHGIDPGRLQIEITETFLLAQPQRAKQIMDQLRERGIAIALDDFGTGYSSIGYLRQFSFDRVKLDRSLIERIDSDAVQAALVKSTMVFAFALGLRVTAEGVERREEAVALARLGCREFQGFYFAGPMTLEKLQRLLQENSRIRA